MGLFNFECFVCGGGYCRCCNNECPPQSDGTRCSGGQFCWSPRAIVAGNFTWYMASAAVRAAVDPFLNQSNPYFEGDYDGNGVVQVDFITSTGRQINLIIVPEEFIYCISDWFEKYDLMVSAGVLIASEIYCASCYTHEATVANAKNAATIANVTNATNAAINANATNVSIAANVDNVAIAANVANVANLAIVANAAQNSIRFDGARDVDGKVEVSIKTSNGKRLRITIEVDE